jgi:hypothetical protein
VTHPGRKERKAIQSVNIHLIRLYYFFEKNLRGEYLLRIIKRAAENEELHTKFEWLDSPSFADTLTVNDVMKAQDMSDHKRIVKEWGESVWKVWKNTCGEKIELLATEVTF